MRKIVSLIISSFLLTAIAIAYGIIFVAVAGDNILKEEPPPPPDLNFLNHPFNSCKALPKELTPLTSAEKCWVEKLSARCTPADDCLVSCLVSTKARGLGGGCWHACFQVKYPLSEWTEPKDANSCHALGHVDGI